MPNVHNNAMMINSPLKAGQMTQHLWQRIQENAQIALIGDGDIFPGGVNGDTVSRLKVADET